MGRGGVKNLKSIMFRDRYQTSIVHNFSDGIYKELALNFMKVILKSEG